MTVMELGLNQRDAAWQIGISHSRLLKLTRGEFDGLSQAKLDECLVALGHDGTMQIWPRHRGVGARWEEGLRQAA
ncbi:MAG: Helix-turn-helix domain [Pseudomonadota bacterium]